jgi:hypothetical protein
MNDNGPCLEATALAISARGNCGASRCRGAPGRRSGRTDDALNKIVSSLEGVALHLSGCLIVVLALAFFLSVFLCAFSASLSVGCVCYSMVQRTRTTSHTATTLSVFALVHADIAVEHISCFSRSRGIFGKYHPRTWVPRVF